MKRVWTTLLVAAGTLMALSGAPPEGERIRARDLRRHVKYLASDDLSGRETGEPGIARAETYIAEEFRRAGLSPLPGRDSYWIGFELYREGFDPGGTTVEIVSSDGSTSASLGETFRPFPFSDSGVVEAPVVFAGYGISAPEHAYDDFAGIDVEGKIVLVLRHEPGETDPDSSFDGTSSSGHALFATKADNARAHGAVGMLLVTDPLHHGPDDDLRIGGRLRLERGEASGTEADDDPDSPFLAVHIGQQIAAGIVESSGQSLEDLQREIDAGATPADLPAIASSARIAIDRSPGGVSVPARNVAGFVEGSDPELKREWIVVGAHHDHVGGYAGRGDTVFNGADDNASGTAGVIALARAFASRPAKPRRSIAFVTFSAEEKGLLGSRALVEQRLLPIDRIVYMLNLDMIGRNPERPVRLYGDGYVRGLREIVAAANAEIALPVDFAGAEYNGNSDHHPFYEHGIPFSFLFTGVHGDYHQPGDHADKLDYARMESIVRLARGVVDRLADADAAPGFIHHIAWLGTRLEVLAEKGRTQAVLTAVDEASRAAQAGLRVGDVVAGIGDARPEPGEIGRRFNDVAPGTRVDLHVRRGQQEQLIAVERARTGYMGIAPGPLAEDQRVAAGLRGDEGFVLRQVMIGGPSELAGLREGDIVVLIDGRPVGTNDLRRRLMQIGAGERVDVSLIRDGERMTLPVILGDRPERR